MTDVDTSVEAVDRSCNQQDLGLLPEQAVTDLCRTLAAERDALKADIETYIGIANELGAESERLRETMMLIKIAEPDQIDGLIEEALKGGE